MAENRSELNKNLAQMLKGGVIMDVTTPEQARVAEDAGACAVMALERIPADIRAAGGVSRMSDPAMIKGIQEAVSIPVMAKVRIGHIAEARILQAIDIDYIDESEVLSPADDVYHIDKTQFDVPFVCGAKNLGEALRRIAEGAAMIRTKGEPGTGDVIQAVRHMRTMNKQIRELVGLRDDEVFEAAKQLAVPVELARYVHDNGRLPVVNFAAGKPVFGTCAGMILLAKRLENDDNVYFGALDATVRRNAYGRQLGSFVSTADFGDIKDFPLVFIRGPFVSDVGADATIETEVDGRVVGLRQGNILATAFHPELTDDTRIHELFLSL